MTTKAPRKNSRKNVVMAISLVVALLITGAFAYLTDSDTATNTFTVGDVKIDLMEPTWDDALDTDNDGNPDYADNIWAGKIIDKDPKIKNTGNNDAYVYLKVTVPMASVFITENDGTPIVNGPTEGDMSIQQANLPSYLPLFTYITNEGWELLGEPHYTEADSNGEGTATYLYYYDGVLAPEAVTPALFNEVTFVNLMDNHNPQVSAANIEITAYAIQSNFGDGTSTITPADAWELYEKQNGGG